MSQDTFFQDNWERGMELTESKKSQWRKDRFYNLVSALRSTTGVDGHVVECGCFTGLSSYLLCHEIKKEQISFKGETYHIYDSFEGLSQPNSAETKALAGLLKVNTAKGLFSATQELVKKNLQEFSQIAYHPGFIPQTLDAADNLRYRFVHLDMDLAEPTVEACKHFYPRLSKGGMIVCDDYGSHLWAETKKAVDKFCDSNNIPLLTLSTGQAVLLKW
jgi:O-methyltransferase